MVSVKGKSNAKTQSRVSEAQRSRKNVGTRSFKVYSDPEDIKICGREAVDADSVKIIRKPVMAARVSIGPSTGRVRASSRKPDMGKTRANQIQGAENHHTLKKVSIKDFKVNPNNQKLKGQGHDSVGTDGRITARKPLMPIRKSLPVTRRANQIYSSDVKGYAENSKGTGKYGFHVKTKVGGSLLPETSNARSYLWRNRASDGFLSMAPVDQSTVNGYALSRKPVRQTMQNVHESPLPDRQPIARTTRTASNILLTSRSKSTLGLKKSISATARSSKNAEEVAASYIHENIPLVVPHESTQGKLPSDKNSYLSTNTSDMIPRSKCSRRRSYTSLLMAKSKVIGVHAVIKQEELPSIDDNSNHLEVAEYVDEIYQYYWVMEVHLKFDLMQETLFLMVTLLDRFLSIITIKKNEMQLVGLTALLLASKYEDFWHPKVKDLISISADSYTRNQMLGMEKLILKQLKFRLNAPTSYVFMLRDCAEMILRFQKSAGRGLLKVTYEKYMQRDLSCAADITAMDRLPL
ncbi:hypothetical protein HHK36_023165 [Tetracentron sinense]|uniref:Cyclin-like domain-containing protein n=1 Tax=Tetracentron sinense TaxID=13715 RepID=A0A834YPY9_TETSI|nr:hypothetical protein HHK36_023165 [Tetracentron sinense]